MAPSSGPVESVECISTRLDAYGITSIVRIYQRTRGRNEAWNADGTIIWMTSPKEETGARYHGARVVIEMCWLHKWEYYGDRLRTCQKCGVHQYYYVNSAAFGWGSIGCKDYGDKVEAWKKAQYDAILERAKLSKESLECKHYNHKDNKPKVRLMPSMMVIRKKAEEE